MFLMNPYFRQIPQIILQGLVSQHASTQVFCLSYDIHFEHIQIFCDLFLSFSPDIQLGPAMQIFQIYVDIWSVHTVHTCIHTHISSLPYHGRSILRPSSASLCPSSFFLLSSGTLHTSMCVCVCACVCVCVLALLMCV